jgi:cephalosporin-C deacetylase-like acetyl esterase
MGGPSIGRNHGEWFVEWVPQLGYYDPVNMARRIPKTCRVDIVRAGLGDYTCPPTGIAAFYNNLSGPKSIVWVQGSKHGYVPPDPQKIPMKD